MASAVVPMLSGLAHLTRKNNVSSDAGEQTSSGTIQQITRSSSEAEFPERLVEWFQEAGITRAFDERFGMRPDQSAADPRRRQRR
jgi:hypothetical protein